MTTPPDVDRNAGMESYAGDAPPCHARVKALPEDFRVEEALGGLEVGQEPGAGLFPLYKVEKRKVDTLHLERELSAAVRSRVSFAGLKDKRAVAVQYFTPSSSRATTPPLIEGDRFRAELVGYVDRPLSRGMIAGNMFRLTLRDCCHDIGDRIAETFEIVRRGRAPNFYGLQRFGASGALTHRVGKALVKQSFAEAVRMLIAEPRAGDDARTAEARELMARQRYSDGAKLFAKGQDTEAAVASWLGRKPDDWVGALRAIPIRLRRLYAQAYQSYIFNRSLSLAARRGLDISSAERGDNWGEVSEDTLSVTKVHGVKEPLEPGGVPLIQFAGYAYRDYGSRFDSCVGEVMADEGVAPKEFYVEGMQEVSVEGGFRRPHIAARDMAFEVDGDVARLSFVLARGEYATVLVREAVKPTDPQSQGFA